MKWFNLSTEEVLSRHNVFMLMVALLLFSTTPWIFLLCLFHHHSIAEMVLELAQSLVIYVCTYEAFRWSMRWCHQTHAGGWKAVGISLLMQALLYYPLLRLCVDGQIWLLGTLGIETPISPEERTLFSQLLWLIEVIYAYLSTYFLRFLLRSREQQVENLSNRAENLQKEASLLKKHLSPHFLFNSLNTLEGLMAPDNERGKQFLSELSNVYRFQLRNSNIVSLRDELSFTRSYLYMMQVRFGTALEANIQVDPDWMESTLPSVSIQLLVENAIKHNALSKEQPLKIEIASKKVDGEAHIVVSNDIIPKEFQYGEYHSGTGLSNLNERYRLLGMPEINIRKDNHRFSVEIAVATELWGVI